MQYSFPHKRLFRSDKMNLSYLDVKIPQPSEKAAGGAVRMSLHGDQYPCYIIKKAET
jgi:hypothetical protein